MIAHVEREHSGSSGDNKRSVLWVPARETVPNPRFGQEIARMAGVRFQLFSQLTNKHTQMLLLARSIRAPDAFQNRPMRFDRARPNLAIAIPFAWSRCSNVSRSALDERQRQRDSS